MKKWTIKIIIAVLIIGLLVGLFFFLKYQREKEDRDNLNSRFGTVSLSSQEIDDLASKLLYD